MKLYSGTAGTTVAIPETINGPILLVQGGLAGTETATVQVYNGAAWQDYLDSSNAVVKLSATVKNLTLPVKANYRLVITASAATTTIAFYHNV